MKADLINVGLSIYGTKEAPGVADNAFILQMAKDCNISGYTHDSIAWCSLAMNWVAMRAGYERSKLLNARSWLAVGSPTDAPEAGDVVVLQRGDPNGWEGHVGIYINMTDTLVYIMGGNQADMYNISSFDKSKVLGYRQLKKTGI
jgi:uncharacterized protein (TIGR02594 family)